MDRKLKYNLVNTDTGDIDKHMYEGDRILTPKQEDFLQTHTQICKKEDFIKIFIKPLLLLSSELTNTEAWFVTYLLQYLDYQTCILKYTRKKNLEVEHMVEDLGYSDKTVYRILKSLDDKGVVARVSTEGHLYIYMNPFIFLKGKYVENSLIDMFKETKWANVY